jgi:hypothetical protein
MGLLIYIKCLEWWLIIQGHGLQDVSDQKNIERAYRPKNLAGNQCLKEQFLTNIPDEVNHLMTRDTPVSKF